MSFISDVSTADIQSGYFSNTFTENVLQGVVISSKLDHFDTSFENLIFHLNNFPFSCNLSEILNLSSHFRS